MKDERVFECCAFPPFRHTVDDASVPAAGEAETDEPLLVKLPRCFFQQLHPPPVVFDQVVVSGKHIGNAPLIINGRNRQFEVQELFEAQIVLSGTLRHLLIPLFDRVELILNEADIAFRFIGNKSDDAVRKASINIEDRRFCDVSRNGDAHSAFWP